MPTATQLLTDQMDEGYRRVRDRIEGSDEEFWCEPVPDVWTVRRRPNGPWMVD